MAKNFSEAFIEHLATSGRKVSEVAEAAGVNSDALYSLKYKKTKNMAVDDAIRVAAAFGKSVEEFMGIPQVSLDAELLAELEHLNAEERELLLASIKALSGRRRQTDQKSDEDEAEASPAERKTRN